MFLLAHVDVQVLVAAVLADDHALVDFDRGADKQFTTFLSHEERIGRAGSGFEGYQRTMRCHEKRLFIRRGITGKHVVQNDGTAGLRQQDVFQADNAARRDVILNVHFAGGAFGMHELHVTEFAASFADFFNHRPLIFRRNLNGQLFKGFRDCIAFSVQDDLGLRDLQLISFTTHLFDQHAEMKFATAGHEKPVGAVCFLHAQGDVGFQLLEQSFTQVARGQVFSVTAGERAVVDRKRHLHGRFVDRHARERDRIGRIGNRVTDVHFFQAGESDNFTRFSRFDIGALKA